MKVVRFAEYTVTEKEALAETDKLEASDEDFERVFFEKADAESIQSFLAFKAADEAMLRCM